ncbi:MAG TPA: hypothetical protein VM925_16310 [Labilithrix sp.]|jgi:hypothetical protein|nr:hypothetical protein [Labilithrix sp.]
MGIDWTTIIESAGTLAVLAMVGGPTFYFAARAERRRRAPAPDFLDAFDDLVLAIAGPEPLDAKAHRRDVGRHAR